MTNKNSREEKIPRCALLASGRGSNALSLLAHQKANPTLFEVPLLVTDNPQAGVLHKLQDFDVEPRICSLPRGKNNDPAERRREHEQKLEGLFREFDIQWLLLAGYKRLLSKEFLSSFWWEERGHYRVINIHPSLLPDYPGLDAYERAFEDQVDVSGVTVHFVDAGMDTGPILAQEKFPRYANDDLESFQSRGLEIEHALYPRVLEKVFHHQYDYPIGRKG